MKKLICADDIKKLVKQGKKTLCINADTIMTPSAKDALKAAGVEVTNGKKERLKKRGEDSSKDAISCDMIYAALKMMQSQDQLNEISDESCSAFAEAIQFLSDEPARY